MIDDSAPDPWSRSPRPDVVRALREGLADRLPAALRSARAVNEGAIGGAIGAAAGAAAGAAPGGASGDRSPRSGPPGVPWRAVAVALVLAVMVGAVLVARAQAPAPAEESGSAVPRRAAPSREIAASPSTWSPSGAVTPGAGVGAVASGTVVRAAGVVVVHVVGRVRRQGLVRLPAGSRVSDAVTAAGGPVAGARLDRLNLARLLTDGEQIALPGPNDPVVPAAAGGAGSGGSGGAGAVAGAPVDLNAATTADLDALPGVGPVLAGRILAWRTQHGRFTRVAELGEVPGIGDKMLAQLTPLVRV